MNISRPFLVMAAFLALLISNAAPGWAQGGAPAAAGAAHFSVTASAVGFTGTNSASAATIAGGSISATRRFALGYQQIIIPNENASFYFGELQYTVPLPALAGKRINSHFVFDSAKYSVTFFAGGGVVRQTAAAPPASTAGAMPVQVQRVAETLGVGLNYVADSHVTIQIVSGQWVHGALQGTPPNQLVSTPSMASISAGLKISF